MPSSDAHAYKEFIATAINNKASYIMMAIVKKKKLIANFAWKITKLFCHKNFAL